MAQLIDGKATADKIIEEIAAKVADLKSKTGKVPSLSVILVGNDPASQSYVRGKIKASARTGIDGKIISLDESTSESELLDKIAELNSDPETDGILVQLPLPEHIDPQKIIDAVALEKDVDGFHPMNVARLCLNEKCTLPCTPKGIIRLIDNYGIEIEGKKAVIVGRSNIVGKPVAKLLLDRNATVTIAHSHSKDLASICREADILVVAAGSAGLITADMVKPGSAVIDVGINRNPVTGKLCGDVDFGEVSKIAGYITPVPGGVGPMTIAMLMENTLECFIRRKSN